MPFFRVVLFFTITVLLLFSASIGKSLINSRKPYQQLSLKDEIYMLMNKKFLQHKIKSVPNSIAAPLIAIEIVDPNEEKNRTGKTSKRTINGHLGYGYHHHFHHQDEYYLGGKPPPPPTFMVYKYSQHDIPPYNYAEDGNHVDLKPPSAQVEHYYQPGTTLYTRLGSHGQLTTPILQLGHDVPPQVPILVLRVLPSQLSDPTAVLHPNLPQNHPLAATLNHIDLNALLYKYVQSVLEVPRGPVHQPVQYYYNEDKELLTHENHPKDSHTQVILKGPNGRGSNDYSVPVALPSKPHTVVPPSKTIKIHLPPSISGVHVEENTVPYHPQHQYQYSHQYYPEEPPHPQQQESPELENPQSITYFYMSHPEQQQEQDYTDDEVQTEKPYNYHAHQKRHRNRQIAATGPDEDSS